jgi:hypothetical protein
MGLFEHAMYMAPTEGAMGGIQEVFARELKVGMHILDPVNDSGAILVLENVRFFAGDCLEDDLVFFTSNTMSSSLLANKKVQIVFGG